MKPFRVIVVGSFGWDDSYLVHRALGEAGRFADFNQDLLLVTVQRDLDTIDAETIAARWANDWKGDVEFHQTRAACLAAGADMLLSFSREPDVELEGFTDAAQAFGITVRRYTQ